MKFYPCGFSHKKTFVSEFYGESMLHGGMLVKYYVKFPREILAIFVNGWLLQFQRVRFVSLLPFRCWALSLLHNRLSRTFGTDEQHVVLLYRKEVEKGNSSFAVNYRVSSVVRPWGNYFLVRFRY